MNAVKLSPIGIITSCFKEKFGIPRQPGLVDEARAELHLNSTYGEESIRGLDGFSHLWINFIFHDCQAQGWKPMVRPPRLGGNAKVGVFASRSPFRPNSLGLSVVELLDIEMSVSQVILHLGGCDLLDGTPVLDIKPYLPYVDAIQDAKGGFAENSPECSFKVEFSNVAQQQCQVAESRTQQHLFSLIEQVLQLDPRPSYQQGNISNRIYSMKLYDFDLKWQYCENNIINVLELKTIKN